MEVAQLPFLGKPHVSDVFPPKCQCPLGMESYLDERVERKGSIKGSRESVNVTNFW